MQRAVFTVGLTLIGFVQIGCQSYRAQPLIDHQIDAGFLLRDLQVPTTLERVKQSAATRPDDSQTLNIVQAQRVMFAFNTDLQIARSTAILASRLEQFSGLLEDPAVALDLERILKKVDHPWTAGGIMEFSFPISNRLGIEKKIASTMTRQHVAQAWALEEKLIWQLREKWNQHAWLARKTELLKSQRSDLELILKRVDALQQAGELASTDIRPYRVEKLRLSGHLLKTSAQLEQARLELLAHVGLPASSNLKFSDESFKAIELSRSIDGNPNLLVEKWKYEIAEKQLELEIEKQWPDLTIGGGPGTEDGLGKALFSLRLPVGLWNRNQKSIASANANRDIARLQYQKLREELTNTLIIKTRAIEAAEANRKYLQDNVQPEINRQIVELKNLGNLGEFNVLILLEAIRQSHSTSLELLDAAMEVEQLSRIAGEVAGSDRALPGELKQ